MNQIIFPNNHQRLEYLERCSQTMSVIPINKNSKKPIDDTLEAYKTIRRPFEKSEFINTNAAFMCGLVSDIIVLDVDNPLLFQSVQKRYGFNIPNTHTVKTGKQGFHYYFLFPDDQKPYHTRIIKTLGFDIKASGYVLAPGSIHPKTGIEYEIINHSNPVPTPDWIKELCLSQNRPEWKKIKLEELPIPESTKQLIKTKIPIGDRSEPMMTVLDCLASKGFSFDQVLYIFYTFPIGEKFIEAGNNRDNWLKEQYEKAKDYTGTVQDSAGIIDQNTEVEIVYGNEFRKRTYTVTPLIDNFLEELGSLLLVGQPGLGKSLITLNIALVLGNPPASGLWSRFHIPKPLKTIIIQSENNEPHVWYRINQICKGDPNLKIGDRNLILPYNGKQFRWTGESFKSISFRDKILKIKDKTAADLLIIDPLVSFSGVDENSNSEMRRSLDAFTNICTETGLASIIVHHTGKQNADGIYSARGASAIPDWASNIITLKRETVDKDQLIKVTNEKARTFEPFEQFYLRMNKNFIMEPVHPKGLIKTSDILNIIKKNKGVFNSKKEFIAAIIKTLKCSGQVASDAIDHVVSTGLIVTSKGNKKSIVYKIT